MNILDFKRKALGYHFMCGGGGDGGGGGGDTAPDVDTSNDVDVSADTDVDTDTDTDLASDNEDVQVDIAPSTPSPNYGGYTTGSSQNATSSTAVGAAQSAYSGAAPSTGANPNLASNYGGYTTGSSSNTTHPGMVQGVQNAYSWSGFQPGQTWSGLVDSQGNSVLTSEGKAALDALGLHTTVNNNVAANSVPGAYGVNGSFSIADLKAKSAAGQGDEEIAPGQTVDQAIASYNVATYGMPLAQAMITAAVPGAGLAMSIARTLENVNKGMPISDAIIDAVFGNVAKALGISTNNLNAALSGNMGQLASNVAQSALTTGISKATGINPSVVGTALGMVSNETGVGQGLASSVNNALGNPSTGFSLSGIKSDVNNALGGTSLPGTTSTGSYSGAASGITNPNDYSGANGGISNLISTPTAPTPSTGQSTPQPSTAPITPTATPAKTSSAPTLAQILALGAVTGGQQASKPETVDIKSYVDPFGTFNPVQAKTGGSIDDLLRLVRS